MCDELKLLGITSNLVNAEKFELRPHAPTLTETERREIGELARPRAALIHEVVRQGGEEDLRRSTSSLAWSGTAAGLSMGFSLVADGLLRAHLPEAEWRPLISKLGYSVGFLIVVLGRQQLFTENTLTVILPWLHRRTTNTLVNVLRVWTVVLATNLFGAFLFALIISHTEVFRPEVKQAFAGIAREAQGGGFGTTILRGIFAGWLIALMVWLLPAVGRSKVAVVFLLTYLVGLGGFTHIVVGSVEVFYAVVTGETSWGAYLGGYALPTFIGNALGGVSLVAWLNHEQVVSGEEA
jgi:formate/nitrite transporter FocA (FNT family)